MRCPKCGLEQMDAPACRRCGEAMVPAGGRPAEGAPAGGPPPEGVTARPTGQVAPLPASVLRDMGPRRNLFEQQAINRRKTALLIAGFVLFLAFLGYGVDRFVLGYQPKRALRRGQVPVPVATILAVLGGAASAWVGYRSGDQLVLGSCHARPLVPKDLAEKTLDNVVEEMAIAAGLPKPRVYVVPDPDPNAFATGRDPDHAAIAVTRGLLDVMNREELQGVVAHEMSHIRNYDIRTMTVVAALLGGVLLLHDWAGRAWRWAGTDSDDDGGRGRGAAIFFVLWILAIVLAPLIGQAIAMAISRSREYLADASGAELTRNPAGLASALRKLDGATAPTLSMARGTAHLCICDPLGRSLGAAEGFLADLLATHPPIGARIRMLERMAYRA